MLVIFIFTGCTQVNYSVQEYVPQNNNTTKNSVDQSGEKSFWNSNQDASVNNVDEIAIIFPSHTIGKYALEATNSISTYLINKDNEFTLSVYDIIVQNKKNILDVVEKLKKDNVKKVIAMITKDDIDELYNITGIEDITFYFPLINKYDLPNKDKFNNHNFTFGAISYKDQFKKLIEFAAEKKLVEFYGSSAIGRTLHNYLKNETIVYTKKIDDNNGQYQSFLKENEKLDDSVVLLNTPIVKSSILLSAINAEELEISSIVSTQLNYTPLLFSLTQKNDRTKLVIANSIGNIPDELEEYNTLIGNNLSYSWVNYATIVGVEYLLNGEIDIFADLLLKEKQVVYPVNLFRIGNNSFRRIQ